MYFIKNTIAFSIFEHDHPDSVTMHGQYDKTFFANHYTEFDVEGMITKFLAEEPGAKNLVDFVRITAIKIGHHYFYEAVFAMANEEIAMGKRVSSLLAQINKIEATGASYAEVNISPNVIAANKSVIVTLQVATLAFPSEEAKAQRFSVYQPLYRFFATFIGNDLSDQMWLSKQVNKLSRVIAIESKQVQRLVANTKSGFAGEDENFEGSFIFSLKTANIDTGWDYSEEFVSSLADLFRELFVAVSDYIVNTRLEQKATCVYEIDKDGGCFVATLSITQ